MLVRMATLPIEEELAYVKIMDPDTGDDLTLLGGGELEKRKSQPKVPVFNIFIKFVIIYTSVSAIIFETSIRSN